MSITITLTPDQAEILSQALRGRELQLEQLATSHPQMASALPMLREIQQQVGNEISAMYVRARQAA